MRKKLESYQGKVNKIAGDFDCLIEMLGSEDTSPKQIMKTRSYKDSPQKEKINNKRQAIIDSLEGLTRELASVRADSTNVNVDDLFNNKSVNRLFSESKEKGKHLINDFDKEIEHEADKIRRVRTTEELKREVMSMDGGNSIINYSINQKYIKRANSIITELKEQLSKNIISESKKQKPNNISELEENLRRTIRNKECRFDDVFQTDIKSNLNYEMTKLNVQRTKVTIMSVIKDPALWVMIGIGFLCRICINTINSSITPKVNSIKDWGGEVFGYSLTIADLPGLGDMINSISSGLSTLNSWLNILFFIVFGIVAVKIFFAGRIQRKLYKKRCIDNVVDTIKGSVDINKMKDSFTEKINNFQEGLKNDVRSAVKRGYTSQGDQKSVDSIIRTLDQIRYNF